MVEIEKPTVMKSIIEQLEQLNADYRSGKLDITHKQYLKRFASIKNSNSVSARIKKFGGRIRKDGVSGYYIYEGVNFTAKLNEASCETTWWEVNLWDDAADQRVVDGFTDYNRWDTRNEVLEALLSFDQELSNNQTQQS